MSKGLFNYTRTEIIVSVVAFTIIIIVSYILNIESNNKLELIEKNKGTTVGTIVEFGKWGTANRYADYVYFVDSVKYEDHTGNAPSFKNCLKDSSCIGYKFEVIYYNYDPTINRILFNSPIENNGLKKIQL